MTEPRSDPSVDELLAEIDAKMMQTSLDLDACRLLAVAARALRAQQEVLFDMVALVDTYGGQVLPQNVADGAQRHLGEVLAPSPRTGSSE